MTTGMIIPRHMHITTLYLLVMRFPLYLMCRHASRAGWENGKKIQGSPPTGSHRPWPLVWALLILVLVNQIRWHAHPAPVDIARISSTSVQHPTAVVGPSQPVSGIRKMEHVLYTTEGHFVKLIEVIVTWWNVFYDASCCASRTGHTRGQLKAGITLYAICKIFVLTFQSC